MKILVTGGGGFVGRYVARRMRRAGHEVTALGRSRYPFLEEEGFSTLKQDICDRLGMIKTLAGFDEVHHVASMTGISVIREPFYRINVEGTRNVIEACRANGIKKLIYTSSPSVVFAGDSHGLSDESAPYPQKFLSHYPETKAIAEREVLQANEPGGLRTVSLRPHLVWGPEDTNLIPRILDRARAGRLFIVGDGSNRADVTYVENVAQAHQLASEKLIEGSPVCGKAYFITNDEPVHVWNFINRIVTGVGMQPVTRKMSYRFAYAAGAMMELMYRLLRVKKEPLMSRFLAGQLAASHCYSVEAAKRDLGYRPEVSVEQGLEMLIEELKK